MHTKNLSIKIESDSGNNNINFMNKDAVPLDTRVGPEYDNIESSSLSFPCLTRESSGKMDHCFSGYSGGSTNMTNRDNTPSTTRMISQSGRSMVEMLGVLAVIGVLSIGGIMGYSYGMDKYRANETINQIMLRAIDLMTQAGNNNETLSFASWNNEASQYDFGTPEYTNDGLIVFDVGTNEKMPKRVCEIVYDAMKDMAVQIDINAVRADSNDACGDDNEMSFYFEGGISLTCDPACPEGQYCDNGICFKGSSPEGSGFYLDKMCSSDTDCNEGWIGQCVHCGNGRTCNVYAGDNGVSCTIKDGNIAGQCYDGQCIAKNNGCTSNDECKKAGTYCASTNNSDEVRFEEGETGACVPVHFTKKEIDGRTYYISNLNMTWWDADYACAALGSNIKLVSVDDFYNTNLANELYDFIGGWTGNYVWTRDPSNTNGYATYVDIPDGGGGSAYYRTRHHAHAVCY